MCEHEEVTVARVVVRGVVRSCNICLKCNQATSEVDYAPYKRTTWLTETIRNNNADQ